EKEPILPPPGSIPPVTTQPGGGTVPDTVRNSLWNKAREESLRAAIPGMRGNTQETAPPSPGARRGVLGLHPMFILVGLIALDIFVVSVAGKSAAAFVHFTTRTAARGLASAGSLP